MRRTASTRIRWRKSTRDYPTGGSTTLTATGGGTYLWSTGATTASITVSPTTTTTYNVYITLASLLHFIETECGLYDGDSPQVKFDFNYDYFGLTNTGNTEVDRNYFFSPPNQFSADPRVCLIPIHKSLNEIIDTLDTGSSFIPLNPSRGGFTGYYNVAPALDFTFSGDRLKRNEMPNFKTGNANAFVGKMGGTRKPGTSRRSR